MTKIQSLILAAAAITFAAACSKEMPEEAPEVAVETVVFTASMDGADSKAVLNETTKYSEWEAGDKVTIHNGTTGFEFTAAGAGASTELSYTGTGFSGSKFMAAYPSCSSADVETKTVNAYISTWQQAQVGTYHHDAALAVAYTENNELAFKNATALLKFTVGTDNVTHVVFHGNLGEGITGNVAVSLVDGTPQVTVLETEFIEKDGEGNDVKVTKKGSWVEMYAYHGDEHKYFEKGETYYIAIAPQTFAEGVTVKIRINEGSELLVKTTTKSATFKANTVYNLGEFTYEAPAVAEWAIAGTFNDWNTTANPMTLEDGYYVIRNVTGMDTGFKFIHKGDWKGSVEEVTAGTWEYIWNKDDGSNIRVKGADATAKYDIYVNPSEGDNGKFVIVPAGQPMPEDGSSTPDTPTTSDWYVAGTFNSWSTTANPMTLENGFYVLKNVTGLNGASNNGGESSTGFKFVYKGAWKGSGNDGQGKTAGQWEYVWGDGGMNIYVAGASATDAYDIYVNPSKGDHGMFVIVPAGTSL